MVSLFHSNKKREIIQTEQKCSHVYEGDMIYLHFHSTLPTKKKKEKKSF